VHADDEPDEEPEDELPDDDPDEPEDDPDEPERVTWPHAAVRRPSRGSIRVGGSSRDPCQSPRPDSGECFEERRMGASLAVIDALCSKVAPGSSTQSS
jgi:hypothetical protein